MPTRLTRVSPARPPITWIRPRYGRPLAIANRFSVTLTAAMPRWGSVRVPSGFTSCTRPLPPESGTTVHMTSAGMEPTGSPLPSSVTNSSPPPSPPNATPEAPTTSATRSSGSPVGAGTPAGRGQATARTTRKLASARFVQRRIELCDREIDVRIRVRAGDERRLERRGRQEHSAGECRPVPAREQRPVGPLGVGVVPHRSGREVHAPHRAGVPEGRGNASPANGVPYTRHQARGSPLQRVVERGARSLPQRGKPHRHRHRVPRQSPRLVDGSFGRDSPHQIGTTPVRPDREPSPDDFAEGREVGADAEPLLRASRRHAEAGHHLVE